MTEQTSYNFLPVIGEESKIINSSQAPGSIYFTTDTRRIYLDWDEKGTNKLLIGGHGNLYYGTMKLENLPVDGQTAFEFNIINDIVGNNDPESNVLIPGINDLILNSDGCFYKVTQIQDNNILIAEKLTIAGTGGSGGGSGTVSGAKFDTSNIFFENGKNTFSTFLDKECWIRFAARYTDEWGEIVSGEIGTYSVWVNNNEVKTGNLQGTINPEKLNTINHLSDEEINKIDIGPYLILGTNSIQVNMLSTSGIPSNKRVTCTTSTLILKWEYTENKINHWIPGETEELQLSWELSGPADKNTYLSIDDGEFFEIGSLGSTSLNYSDYGLSHGVHKIAMKASATVGSDTLFTETIYNNIIVVKQGNNTPILSCNFFESELQQYDTIDIPIVLYDTANTASTASISFLESGIEVGREDNVENGTTIFWHYTPTSDGNIVLTIQYGLTIKTLKLYVHKVDITTQEVPGYAFKFKANEFSGNDMVKQWQSNTAKATFSENFDWINGGLKTEKDKFNNTRQFLRVCARSNMTIDYKPFSTGFQNGKVLKIIFKTANCRTYDAQAISCKADKLIVGVSDVYDYFLLEGETIEYSDEAHIDVNNEVVLGPLKEEVFSLETDDDVNEFNNTYTKINNKIYKCRTFKQIENEGTPDQVIYRYAQWYETFVQESFDGLLLTAQNAIFNTLNNSISTQYCEDTYIELELDITNVDNKFNYIKFWIDGIPVSYAIYDDLDNVNRCATIPLTIGSNDCDVDIYLIKLYNKELKTEDHISNFIMDAPNSNEIINRYRRNNILDDRGEISPSLLATANKDCLVHVYEIERMTKHKKDPIKNCTYQQYHNSLTPVLTAKNVTIKVQGTSSEAYVLAAANIDSDFAVDDPEAGTFMNAITNTAMPEGWSMDGGTAIPCNYFCTKVNVASAENANNALNQEWYNMFQPYRSVLKCKNPKARDTMQFTNGVLFIRDMNPKTDSKTGLDNNVFSDTLGYAPTTERPNSPYAKMYSIANMGNSKNNIHVFHDLENENECCVEVKDNQSAQERMLDFVELQDIDGGKKYFEFRYIKDGKEDIMKQKWQEFVKWMSQSNPQPAYKKHIINSSTDYEAISKHPITKHDIEVFVLNEENNCYDQCANYNQNISEYYTKTDSIHGYTNLELPNSEKRQYGDYEFNGYIVENQKNPKTNEIWQKSYTPLIRGVKTSQYNYLNFATRDNDGNPIKDDNNKIVQDPDLGFTHDTYEYRMAKMLHECENHLCMDSIIYHYLFIEHHCMIDNVAKNTFWSTEDGGEVWNLIKDYDNDTSDGNDNNGKLTRTYGMEPLDRLNKNAHVFNAYESVWFNFIHGLTDVCQQMYTKIANNTIKYKGKTISAWSAEDYLDMFTEWQSCIPERCWIEDYYRKYFRPNEVYNDPFFNGMIEGGQKKYQRQQFEKYQQIYMDSKYEYGTDGIFARPEGQISQNHRMPVVTYSDCYLRLDVGSDQAKIRVKRGEPNYIYCPVSNLTNATFDLLPGSVISSVGSLSEGQLNDYSVDAIRLGGATKLRELIFGSSGKNENSMLDESLSFGANTLLETLYLCNLTAYDKPLDLSECFNLLYLDASNSAFTSVTLADGAPIHTIKLEKPTALQFSNLEKIEEFNIADYSRLNTLKLNNIDKNGLNSINIVNKATNYLNGYKLTDVVWSLEDSSLLNLTNNTIKTLELLDTVSPIIEHNQVLSKAAALTGVLTVPQKMTANQAKIIYDKYVNSEKFANLDIIFTDNDAKLHLVTICDGDGKPFWKKRIVPGGNIDEDFLKSGPQGQFNIAGLYKSPTAQYVYEFTGKWDIKDAEGNLLDTLDDIEANENPAWNNVQKDIYLYPKFTTEIQTYQVRFFNGDTIIKEDTYDYGTPLKNILPTDIPYIVDDSLSLLQGYDFLGYSTVKDGKVVDLDKYEIINHTDLWAVFKKVNDMRECVHEEWFNINQGVCSPKYNLGGKITIPSTATALENFVPNFLQVTHIFLQNNNQLTTINNDCFYVDPKNYERTYKLVYFDFENATSLTTVGTKAFCGLHNLLTYDLTKTKLTTIGAQAFNASFAIQSTSASSPNIIKLPQTIISLGTHAFAYNFYTNITDAENSSATIQVEIGLNGDGVSNDNVFLEKNPNDTNYYLSSQVFASYKGWNPLTLKLNVDSLQDPSEYVSWLSTDAEGSIISIQNSFGQIIP